MDVANSSKTVVPIYQTTRSHKLQGHNLDPDHCANLLSDTIRTVIIYPACNAVVNFNNYNVWKKKRDIKFTTMLAQHNSKCWPNIQKGKADCLVQTLIFFISDS